MTIITIIGSGLMGTAVAYPLSDNGHTIRLVGTHLDDEIIQSCKKDGYHPTLKRKIPVSVTPYYIDEVEKAMKNAEVIVSGVNSLGVHWIGKKLKHLIKPSQKIISITKGLEFTEQRGLMTMPDVLVSELPESMQDQVQYAAVGGPCIAGELAGRRQSVVYFGSRQEIVAKELALIFRTPYYHTLTTTDFESLEYSVALKNAFTLGVGLAYGILERSGGVDKAGAHMHNLAAGLFGLATKEMAKLLEALGYNPDFAHNLPGAGDLFVTVMGGRTVKFARLLGLGHTPKEAKQIMSGETLEALYIIDSMAKAIPFLQKQGVIKTSDLPLLRMLINIVIHGHEVDQSLADFFQHIS